MKYTQDAINFSNTYPRLTKVLIQMNFWIISYGILVFVFHFHNKAIIELYEIDAIVILWPELITSMVSAIIIGVSFGLIDVYAEKRLSEFSIIGLFALKTLMYLVIFLIVWKFGIIFWRYVFLQYYPELAELNLSTSFFKNYFTILLVYTLLSSVIVNIIKQVNKLYGPGVLLPILFGRYRKPIMEERIFLFLDLNNSTELGERLPPSSYSSLIQSCYADLDQVIPNYNAQIYQYVGDEVVLTWPVQEGIRDNKCLNIYFDWKEYIEKKKEYYLENFGTIPQFKAASHMGKVMCVEVGGIRRDLAFHGDVLNTTHRILSQCNDFQKMFLISDKLNGNLENKNGRLSTNPLGSVLLRGKQKGVSLYSVDAS